MLHKSNGHIIAKPVLPRNRRAPVGIEIGSGQPTFPETLEDHYRRIYFEALDLMVNEIEQRFSQPSKNGVNTLKGFSGKAYTAELD